MTNNAEAASRRRGVTGQPTLRSQRARAIRLMEERESAGGI